MEARGQGLPSGSQGSRLQVVYCRSNGRPQRRRWLASHHYRRSTLTELSAEALMHQISSLCDRDPVPQRS